MPPLELSPELRNALGKSAEIGLARAIVLGQDEFIVDDFIIARLSALTPDDLSYMRNLANAIVSAGQYLSSLSPTDQINADEIPTVPVINEDEWSGKRVRTPAQWSPDGGDNWFNFSVDLPDITDFGDLIAYAHNLAQAYIDAYPGRFEGIIGGPLGTLEVRTIGAEKAF
jgi:hypothetical protein